MAARALAEVLSDFAEGADVLSAKPARDFEPLNGVDVKPGPAEFIQWPVVPANDGEPHSAEIGQPIETIDDYHATLLDLQGLSSDDQPDVKEPTGADAIDPADAITDDVPEPESDQAAEEIARIRAEHAAELDQLRQEFTDRQMTEMAERLSEAENTLMQQFETGVAKSLAEIFGDRIADESLTMLCKWLKARLSQPGMMQVEISGPKELNRKLIGMLGDNSDKYRITESETVDVQIDVDGEVLSTRLGEWKKMVEGCLH